MAPPDALPHHDRTRCIVAGFHAVKHAIRFGAQLDRVVCADPVRVLSLADRLAPDIAERLRGLLTVVSGETFAGLLPNPPETGVIAVALRPNYSASDIAAVPSAAPIVLLERPTNLGNVGAAIRASAAAGAAAVCITGEHDPWHPAALRGSAGLHFALPVAALDHPGVAGRPLVAIDDRGDSIATVRIPDHAVLVFGSERTGLSDGVRRAAALTLAIPMQPGVSSLNLATAVAVTLYARRLGWHRPA
jgi:TrmH family RNA methyltransferase